MAPLIKHGGHRFVANLPSQAPAGATVPIFVVTYDFQYPSYSVYDPTLESVLRATYTPSANITGANTNNFAIQLTQYSAAGVVKSQTALLTYTLGIASTAFVPVDLTPTGGIQSGLPLVLGDSIVVQYIQNGTGLAAPAAGFEILVGVPS